MTSRRSSVAALLLGCVCACSTPEVVHIRAGADDSLDQNALRPPSGAVYAYEMQDQSGLEPVVMTLRSKRLAARDYRYHGHMAMSLPQSQGLSDIASAISQTLGDAPVTVKGNTILIPLEVRADNRFRAKRSNIMSDEKHYVPHDCFAVLGTCRHKSIDKKGRSIHYITKTTQKDGVWRTVSRPDPKANKERLPAHITRRAIYSIDRNGVLIDMVIFRQVGSERKRFEIRRK